VLYEIAHVTTYEFTRPVFLEPHTVRLCPRSGVDQRLHDFEFDISPPPEGVAHFIDAEGNTAIEAWFSEMTDALSVRCRAAVETLRANPFDYLPRPEENGPPFECPDAYAEVLAPYRLREASQDPGNAVVRFAEGVLADSGSGMAAFLSCLNERLYQSWEVIHREQGRPWPAARTLDEKRGSCRDLTVLFMDACRALGIAARFVSGYQEGDPDQQDRELHAWAEVFVPGGGWRGFDPTHGLAVADRHVAVAASARPQLAAPITGSFRGTGATATMTARIDVRVGDAVEFRQQQQQQQ